MALFMEAMLTTSHYWTRKRGVFDPSPYMGIFPDGLKVHKEVVFGLPMILRWLLLLP